MECETLICNIMKQNKIFGALGLMLSFYSCLEMEDLSSDLTFPSSVTTRSAGDEKYDVLGYGYDVTVCIHYLFEIRFWI